MTVLEHLYEARHHLRKARQDGGIGTSAMVSDLLAELNQLIQRKENIDERDTDE